MRISGQRDNLKFKFATELVTHATFQNYTLGISHQNDIYFVMGIKNLLECPHLAKKYF